MKKNKMEKEDYLRLGNPFFAHIKAVISQKGRTVLESKTTSGKLELKIWDYEGEPKTGDYLLLEATDEEAVLKEFSDWGSLTTRRKNSHGKGLEYTVAAEDDVPEEIRKKINRDRRPQLAAAMEALRDPSPWRNKEIHKTLLEFIEEKEKKFFNAPAAKEMHHNWRGGLLVHTAEVVMNCIAISSSPMNQFYEIDTDALLLAAWLHDSGKMETYQMNGDSPEIDGKREGMIGHQTMSNMMFRQLSEKKGMDPRFSDLVSHCILSHHERREWGAIVEPQTIEAHILCRADLISSKMPD